MGDALRKRHLAKCGLSDFLQEAHEKSRCAARRGSREASEPELAVSASAAGPPNSTKWFPNPLFCVEPNKYRC